MLERISQAIAVLSGHAAAAPMTQNPPLSHRKKKKKMQAVVQPMNLSSIFSFRFPWFFARTGPPPAATKDKSQHPYSRKRSLHPDPTSTMRPSSYSQKKAKHARIAQTESESEPEPKHGHTRQRRHHSSESSSVGHQSSSRSQRFPPPKPSIRVASPRGSAPSSPPSETGIALQQALDAIPQGVAMAPNFGRQSSAAHENLVSFSSLKWMTDVSGSPDGTFSFVVTRSVYEAHQKLKLAYAAKNLGHGKRTGKESLTDARNADSEEKGLRTWFECLGAFECNNEDCANVVRGSAKGRVVAERMRTLCRCNQPMQHYECNTSWGTIEWRYGVRFWHLGEHSHSSIPVDATISAKTRKAMNDLIEANPTATPAALRAGNTTSGIGLIDVNIKAASAGYSRHLVRTARGGVKSEKNPDQWLDDYTQFGLDYPTQIIAESLRGGVQIISIQTSFMAQMLVQGHFPEAEGHYVLQGFLSDAAHGWFAQAHHHLITTSVFCWALQKWVPTIYSYVNGATESHFEYHFYAWMKSTKTMADVKNVTLDYEYFRMMVDFSQAERLGFIQAFIRFWSEMSSNAHSPTQLEKIASELILGCQQHFRESVNRVAPVVAARDSDRTKEFKRKVKELLGISDHTIFKTQIQGLLLAFPKAKPWLEWWLRPSHIQMLFVQLRTDIPVNMPSTTNAQESMHHAMYAEEGKKHTVIEGLRRCIRYANTMSRTYVQYIAGGRMEYGKKTSLALRRERQAKHKSTQPSRYRRLQKVRKAFIRELRLEEPKRNRRPLDRAKDLLKPKTSRTRRRGQQKTAKSSSGSVDDGWSTDTDTDKVGVAFKSPIKTSPAKKSCIKKSPTKKEQKTTVDDDKREVDIGANSPPKKSTGARAVRSAAHHGQGTPDGITAPRVEVHRVGADIVKPTFYLKDATGGARALVIPGTFVKLLGYRWQDNSCWIDTLLEMLFWTLVRDWTPIQSIYSTSSLADVPLFPILIHIKHRLELTMESKDWDETQKVISASRQTIRQFISGHEAWVSPHGYQSMNSNEAFWRWFSFAAAWTPETFLRSEPHPTQAFIDTVSTFGLQVLKYRACTGADLSLLSTRLIAHSRIGLVQSISTLSLEPHAFDMYHGNIETFLQQRYTQTNGLPRHQRPCWRRAKCPALADDYELCVHLPLVLCMEAYVEPSGATLAWFAPGELHPVSDAAGRENHLIYDLVARIFMKPGGPGGGDVGHFIGRFVALRDTETNAPSIFEYDGYGREGMSYRVGHGIKKWIAGYDSQLKLPAGYATIGLMYRLRGGGTAQNWYSDRQRQRLATELSINLAPGSPLTAERSIDSSRNNLFPVNPHSMSWLSENEQVQRQNQLFPILEYEHRDSIITPPSSKSQATSSIPTQALDDVDDFVDEAITASLQDGTKSRAPPSESSLSTLSRSVSQSSIDSDKALDFRCWCGINGSGHHFRHIESLIQCDKCKYWCHLACYPSDSALLPGEDFSCHLCDDHYPLLRVQGFRKKVAHPAKFANKACYQKDMHERLRVGIAVLVRDGLFWYPARILSDVANNECTIRWWHSNQPAGKVGLANHTPGATARVKTVRIVDHLWRDKVGRRSIRLGKWITATSLRLKKETGPDPSESLPFTPEIDSALTPHQDEIRTLILGVDSDTLSHQTYPVLAWKAANSKLHKGVVPLTGKLEDDISSQIINWIYHKVAKDLKGTTGSKNRWVYNGGLQHGLMIWIAEQNGGNRTLAWKQLVHDVRPVHADIDMMIVSILEDHMFDMRKIAGPAGNMQWGLDVGILQETWSPYELGSERRVLPIGKFEEETSPTYRPDAYERWWNRELAQQAKREEKEKRIADATLRSKIQKRRLKEKNV